MPTILQLSLTDFSDPSHWRWVLNDSRGRFLADHSVRLDPTSREYAGFVDLSAYLDYHQPIYTVAAQLADLGNWIGAQVFGELRTALRQCCLLPAVAVQVSVPAAAQTLLLRPFELARFADGTSFQEAGLRFIYSLEGAPPPAGDKLPIAKALRILAAFSLPVQANPLNLRRERYGLQRLVRDLNQTQGLAVELRVLQYGATRQTLEDAMQEADGWDIIHFSGHGKAGELLLENDKGGSDLIAAAELGDLLALAQERLKLLILDACYSAAGSHLAARTQLGLEPEPERQEGAEGAPLAETVPTVLPSLAQSLAQRLDCAALAMRYPVGDAFATDLMLALYDKLLDKRQPLPAALNLALDEVIQTDLPQPPLSPATPILVGPRSAAIQLPPPARPFEPVHMPTVGLSIAFPSEPARFVGRLQPLLRASQALARSSPKRGVLFYGMPGAGKTACALELAYRHELGRFRGYVWYQAPEAGSDIGSALFNLMQNIQTQLNAPDLGLTTALDKPDLFRSYTLPGLRALLQQHALLLVLDNLETLLTDSDNWRIPLWGELVTALLTHTGPSRLVLTSRRLPAGLLDHPRLQVEAIHALSFAESVLLARELPNLKNLFDDEDGRKLLQQTLRVVQGHPKLLELADGLAADRAALAAQVAAAGAAQTGQAAELEAFFTVGESRQADAGYVRTLHDWTAGVTGGLSPTAALLFSFLCRLEPVDRQRGILDANWEDFLNRLGAQPPAAAAALAEPALGLEPALESLQAAGLLAIDRPALDPEQIEEMQAMLASPQAQAAGLDPAALPGMLQQWSDQKTTYVIHPGVAEAARATAGMDVLAAGDIELGNFHIAMVQRGTKNKMEEQGSLVVDSARRAAPYLLRQARWEAASTLLETMLQRDSSPDNLAFALPLLRRIVEATAGTSQGLENAGVLAKALGYAGRIDEAEAIERDRIQQSVAQGNFRRASVAAGDLLNLLRMSGRLEEALALAEEIAGYTRQAGLGPWTQLADESNRLQVLAEMGRYEQVLAAVEALRPKMAALPLESQADETVDPWNVREALLDTGHTAALYSDRLEQALALNAEIIKSKQARGAAALELARTRFNDYGPLLRLKRYPEARALLLDCRAVFEAEREIQSLGRVYSALADLEDKTGGRAAAIRFEQVALGYGYQAGQPEDCAISHHNLANYLKRQGADPALVLAHRLADAVICYQTRSGSFATSLNNLAKSDLPPEPPAFEAVVKMVEAIEGVRFRELFERLPHTAPDGGAALAAVWRLVQEEKEKRARQVLDKFEPLLKAIAAAATDESLRAEIEPVLADLETKDWHLSNPVQRIWAGERDAAALTAGLDAQDSALVRQMLALLAGQAAISAPQPEGPNLQQLLDKFEPLLQAIAAAATDESLRAEIEPVLADLETKDWHLSSAVQRIWAGERDAAALTAGLDAQDSALVRQVLQLLPT